MCYARALKGDRIELGNNGLISGAFSSDTTLSTPVAINKGGTGQTTAQAALDALAAASGSLVQGDIFIVDSSGNVVRLARGSDNQTLVMDGNNPNWETAGGSLTVNKIQGTITAAFDTSNTTFTATGLALTLSNQTGGNAMVISTFNAKDTVAGNGARCNLSNDGTQITGTNVSAEPVGSDFAPNGLALSTIADTDGSVIEVYIKSTGGTAQIIYSAGNYTPQIIAMEFY